MKAAIVNLKGGVGKSTSAVHLAAGLAARGRTLLVDADPQGSSLSWSNIDGWPIPTVSLPVPNLHTRLDTVAAGCEHVVIDTPPELAPIVRSAVMWVEVVLIPLSPTTIDLDRLRPTLELLAEVENLNAPEVRVLLTKTRSRTLSRETAREVLDRLGVPVLSAEIPLREAYGLAFGVVVPTAGPDYEAVLAELLGEAVPA